MEKYQIFISYRRDGGADLAGRVADRLSIDLTIPHDSKLPHKHLYLDHTTAYDISDDEQELIDKIRNEKK